jgi:hypothetical protein
MKIAKIESIPLRIPFTTGGPSDAGVWGKAGLQTVDSLIVSAVALCGSRSGIDSSAARQPI